METCKIPIFKCKLVKAGGVRVPVNKIDTVEAGALVLQALTKSSPTELFVVIFLDGQLKICGCQVAAMGGRHGCSLTCQDMLRAAIVHNVSSIIVGHNHPSGDPEPSREDLEITAALKAACGVVGIRLVDHIIVAANTTCSLSFVDRGLI